MNHFVGVITGNLAAERLLDGISVGRRYRDLTVRSGFSLTYGIPFLNSVDVGDSCRIGSRQLGARHLALAQPALACAVRCLSRSTDRTSIPTEGRGRTPGTRRSAGARRPGRRRSRAPPGRCSRGRCCAPRALRSRRAAAPPPSSRPLSPSRARRRRASACRCVCAASRIASSDARCAIRRRRRSVIFITS